MYRARTDRTGKPSVVKTVVANLVVSDSFYAVGFKNDKALDASFRV